MVRRTVGCFEVIRDEPKLTRLIKAIYSETQLAVLVNGHLSEWFQMTVGNKQRDIHCQHDHLLCSWIE